jgi:hypothetical protein
VSSDLFSYIKSITYDKNNLMVGEELEEAERQYQPFLVNRGLSFFIDTIIYANEMNRMVDLDNRLQYDYLRESIRKRKRFSKWHKADKSEAMDLVCEAYSCNKTRAREIISLMSDEDVETLKESMYHGGN